MRACKYEPALGMGALSLDGENDLIQHSLKNKLVVRGA